MPRVSAEFSYTHRSFHGFFVTDDLTRRGNINSFYETYTLTAPQDSRLADGGGYPVTVYVPTAAANAVAPQRFLMKEIGPRRRARQRVGWFRRDGERALAQRPDRAGRARARVEATSTPAPWTTLYNQVNAAPVRLAVPTRAAATTSSRGRRRSRGLASYTIPKIDVLVSAVLRSQPSQLLGGTPATSAHVAGAELRDRRGAGSSAAGSDARRDDHHPARAQRHRIYADERRTQVDMRFAKIVRFGRTRTDIGVDLNNVFNTNYATASTPPTSTTRTTLRGRAAGARRPASTIRGSCG